MEFFKASALILIAVILVSCVPTFDKRISAMITISTSILVLGYIINIINPVIREIYNIFQSGIGDNFIIILKTMGITLITQFVSDVASDNGNKALANQMVFTGKIAIVVLALPVFMQVLEIIGQLTG